MPEEIWVFAERPGFSGSKRDKIDQQHDEKYGVGGWKIAHQVDGKFYTWLEALNLFYEEAYFEYLKKNSDILDWLCETASDVYDNAKTNVYSGLDYTIQEGKSNHMQDIAIRRVLRRLERKFIGDELLEIRGKKSKGAKLSPGVVPFHRPDLIMQPELESWWQPGSVESFWQSNKVLLRKKPDSLF